MIPLKFDNSFSFLKAIMYEGSVSVIDWRLDVQWSKDDGDTVHIKAAGSVVT